MGTMIQIRNVPPKLHAALKSRAASEGMSLSDYIRNELEKSADLPTLREWFAMAAPKKPVRPGPGSAEIIRRLRDSR